MQHQLDKIDLFLSTFSYIEIAFLVFLIIPIIYYAIIYPVLLIFGEKYSYKRFQYDKVALFWPFHHLAPAFLLFIVAIRSEKLMTGNFQKMGFFYKSLLDKTNHWIVIGIFTIAIISSIYYIIESRIRLSRNHHKSSWLTQNAMINWTQGIFAMIVCFLLVVAGLVIIWHWIHFYLFFKSNWLPVYPLTEDLLFGTSWIKGILFREFILILLFSFDPIILSLRERKFGAVTHYTRTFLFAFFSVIVCMVMLVSGFNSFLEKTKEVFLSEILIAQKGLSNSLSTIDQFGKLVTSYYEYYQIISIPTKINFPVWFESLFGFRILIFVIDLVKYLMNGSWNGPKKIYDSVSKILKD